MEVFTKLTTILKISKTLLIMSFKAESLKLKVTFLDYQVGTYLCFPDLYVFYNKVTFSIFMLIDTLSPWKWLAEYLQNH